MIKHLTNIVQYPFCWLVKQIIKNSYSLVIFYLREVKMCSPISPIPKQISSPLRADSVKMAENPSALTRVFNFVQEQRDITLKNKEYNLSAFTYLVGHSLGVVFNS